GPPPGRPVRRQQCPVAPDRAIVVAADALPDLAPGVDVLAGVDDASAFGDHLLRNGRCGLVDLAPDPQHDPEADYQQGSQPDPQTSGGIHLATHFVEDPGSLGTHARFRPDLGQVSARSDSWTSLGDACTRTGSVAKCARPVKSALAPQHGTGQLFQSIPVRQLKITPVARHQTVALYALAHTDDGYWRTPPPVGTIGPVTWC